MTKEELIKLSRENLRKSKQGSLCECYDEAFIKGYQLSEKRIEELEKETETLSQNLDDAMSVENCLKKRITDLEAQIEKMKSCVNCRYCINEECPWQPKGCGMKHWELRR